MAIITISRGPFSRGGEVAGMVADRLGYRCLSDEVILDAAQKYQLPSQKLGQALHDPLTVLERFSSDKKKYLAYLDAEILARFKDDNVVYHGLAGHFFAADIAHHLKVRVVADPEDRIALLMKKENLGRGQAVAMLKREDQERRNWSRQVHGIDNTDPSLYHLMINTSKLTVEYAVDLIAATAVRPEFTAGRESQRAIENMALAAAIRAALLQDYPGCEVVADGRSVEIFIRFTLHSDTMVAEKIKERALKMPGVSSVSVVLVPSVLFT